MVYNQQRYDHLQSERRGAEIAVDSAEVEHNSASAQDGKAGRNQVCSSIALPSHIKWLLMHSQKHKTEEKRRQRNRKAQAAFRERRTEYIAQLEKSIEDMKSELRLSQTARSTAVEELLMIKYKNSLLERILLENGNLGIRIKLNKRWS